MPLDDRSAAEPGRRVCEGTQALSTRLALESANLDPREERLLAEEALEDPAWLES